MRKFFNFVYFFRKISPKLKMSKYDRKSQAKFSDEKFKTNPKNIFPIEFSNYFSAKIFQKFNFQKITGNSENRQKF